MNRASLLHILDHTSGISEAEVRELEQLAAAFPYCQTAHLLLAKAAHDRGSMLAGQRLRRAATYAADRELLRALIERPAPEPLAATPPAGAVTSPAPDVSAAALVAAPEEPSADAAAPETPVPAATPEPATTSAEPVAATEEAVGASEEATNELVSTGPESVQSIEEAPLAAEVELAVPAAAEAETIDQEAATAATAVEPTVESANEPEASPLPESAAAETKAPPLEVPPPQPEPAEVAASLTEPGEPAAAAETSAPAAPAVEEVAEVTAEAAAAEVTEPDVEAPVAAIDSTAEAAEPEAVTAETPGEETLKSDPATAAPTSTALLAAGVAAPPVLLSTTNPDAPAATADELPPAAPPIRPPVEAGSSRFEFGLGEAPDPLPAYQLPELPEEEPAPTRSFPSFRADELLAYALSGGSRLGSALTLRAAELTTDLPLEAAWPADAAVLAHLAANRPVPPPAPSSLALIDKFLRSQPRIKNAQRPAPTDSPQADLSVRSTSATPSLASESLAKIMVKQGKIGRAIEIYEQLMQRQPEKKAYFAAQIDLLNQHSE